MSTKAMTVRLSSEQAEALEWVAAVDQSPISEIVRKAIEEHVSSRMGDQLFQEGLRHRVRQGEALLTGGKP